jgi:L-alanine-DL-glutamate epimerase-like enolase superfamily enzyme
LLFTQAKPTYRAQPIGGCYADKFPITAAVIGIDKPEIMADVARDSLKNFGPEARMLKIKLGLEYLKDVKRVEAIREAIGPDHYLYSTVTVRWR